MKTKRFVYEIVIEGPCYCEQNMPELFGEGSYFNPDIKEDEMVRDDLGDIFQEAITQRISFKLDALANTDMTEEFRTNYLKKMDESVALYRKVRDSLKLVRVEV